MTTANSFAPDEAFTPMLLAEYAKRSQQLRISFNKQRPVLRQVADSAFDGVFVHRALRRRFAQQQSQSAEGYWHCEGEELVGIETKISRGV